MKKINLRAVANFLIIAGIILIIFTGGRLYQQKKDNEMYIDYVDRYYDLLDEYEEYKENSYILLY